jgi:hypothetical protein
MYVNYGVYLRYVIRTLCLRTSDNRIYQGNGVSTGKTSRYFAWGYLRSICSEIRSANLALRLGWLQILLIPLRSVSWRPSLLGGLRWSDRSSRQIDRRQQSAIVVKRAMKEIIWRPSSKQRAFCNNVLASDHDNRSSLNLAIVCRTTVLSFWLNEESPCLPMWGPFAEGLHNAVCKSWIWVWNVLSQNFEPELDKVGESLAMTFGPFSWNSVTKIFAHSRLRRH